MIHANDLRKMKDAKLQSKLDQIENGLIDARKRDMSYYETNISGSSPEQIEAILMELKDNGYVCTYEPRTRALTVSWILSW
jgi:ribosomal protein L29